MEEKQGQKSVNDGDSKDFQLPTSQNGEFTAEITREEFLDFIDNEADKYFTKFRKFYSDGHDKFAFTWHWPAFFFALPWLAYRKLYVWALVLIFLSLVPILNILLVPVFGLTANYLYYKHTKKKILSLKTTQTFSDSTQMKAALQKIGGVNPWAGVLAITAVVAVQILYQLKVAL